MRNSMLAKAIVILMPLFLMCSVSYGAQAAREASDISLPDMNGKMVQLSSLKGKVIILDFFATWCPPCRQEIPDFVALQREYAGPGLAIVGVSLTAADDVKPFAEKLGINYTILIGDDKASAAYGPIRSIPTTFVIDREFKIAKKYIGFQPKEVFERDIKELLR